MYIKMLSRLERSSSCVIKKLTFVVIVPSWFLSKTVKASLKVASSCNCNSSSEKPSPPKAKMKFWKSFKRPLNVKNTWMNISKKTKSQKAPLKWVTPRSSSDPPHWKLSSENAITNENLKSYSKSKVLFSHISWNAIFNHIFAKILFWKIESSFSLLVDNVWAHAYLLN